MVLEKKQKNMVFERHRTDEKNHEFMAEKHVCSCVIGWTHIPCILETMVLGSYDGLKSSCPPSYPSVYIKYVKSACRPNGDRRSVGVKPIIS